MAAGFSTALRNARADAITAAIGSSGLLQIYDGTRPASGGAVTTLLAQLALSATAAPAAAAGVLTFNSVTADASADNSGTATWFRITTSGGTFVIDGACGIGGSGAECIMATTTVTASGTVSVASIIITEGNA
jgi:hypothetical protein